MKKLTFIAFILSMQFAATLYAFDWSTKGVKELKKSQSENEIVSEFADSSGRKFTVKYYDEVSAADADIILELNTKFYSWKNMKPARINFLISNRVIEIAVIPDKFSFKEENIMKYLPAGMLFMYTDSLSYNFRITKNNIFVRIKGKFKDEEELCEKTLEAIKDPLAYLKKRDPEFFLTKLTALEESYRKLQRDHEQLAEKHAKLLYAVMTLHNTGFLGFGVNPIDKKAVSRIIAIKRENPSIKPEEIEEKMKKEGFKISDDEIILVLSVYYNEFKK